MRMTACAPFTAPISYLYDQRPQYVRPALEEIRLRGARRRVVDEHDQRLPPHVEVFVIVPAVLRSIDAVSHKDDLGIELSGRVLRLVHPDELVEVSKGTHGRPAVPHEGDRALCRVVAESEQTHLLEVGVVVAGRRETHHFDLAGEILSHDCIAPRARTASFEEIAR